MKQSLQAWPSVIAWSPSDLQLSSSQESVLIFSPGFSLSLSNNQHRKKHSTETVNWNKSVSLIDYHFLKKVWDLLQEKRPVDFSISITIMYFHFFQVYNGMKPYRK